jgi:PAS domain S-box-containing protein
LGGSGITPSETLEQHRPMTTPSNLSAASALGFLDGGGDSARRIRACDWTGHPLGAPEIWPEGLRTALSLILNSPESMILCWDAGDLFFFFNDAYQPLLGPRLDWAMGAPFREVWADAWEQAQPIIADAFAGRAVHYDDLPWKLARYGREEDTWFSFSYSRVLDGDGGVAGLLVFTNETTQRYLGERALREAGELLDRAQHAGGIGLFSIDVGKTVQTTRGLLRLFGLPDEPGDMALSRFEDLVLAEDRHLIAATELQAGAQVAAEREFRIRRADTGEVRWIAREGEVERNRDGLPLRFVGVARDVTDQVETRQALAAAKDRLAELLVDRTRERDRLWTLSRDPFLIANRAGLWLNASPAWTDILGWTEAELLGRTAEWIEHPDERESNDARRQRLANGGKPIPRIENRYRTRAGDYRWFAWTIVAEDDRLFCVARDVTAEKQRAADLARAEDQLRQAQKVEAVGQLTGGVAHDFNNLLTVIRGSIDLLRRPGVSEERRERYLGAIADTAERAARLTGQLLAFARRQSLRPETFDVGASVLALREMVETLSGPRITLAVELPDQPVFVDADRSQFDTAIVNIAANARDAMHGEGMLTIRVGATLSRPAIRSHAAVKGEHVTVTLIDTGAGIEASRLDQIFEPFYTTKDVGHGTGLGLSQVFGFVKQSGGDIMVDSAAGRGATFSLYLPRVAEVAAAATGAAGDLAAPAGRRATILVVEDNVEVGRFARRALTELGHHPVLVTGAAAALDELSRERGRFDLLFSDVVMPGQSGIELGRAVRRLYPDLPVVLTSGYSAVLAESGSDGFALLHKPYTLETLAATLTKALAATSDCTTSN